MKTLTRKMTSILPGITMGMLAVTGFAQMPIFKRYYIADIPGLAWLAKFYVTHYLHYLLAALLLALLAYQLVSKQMAPEKRPYPWMTRIQWGILAGLVATGIVMVIRNLPGYHFSPATVIAVDLLHLGFTLVLMIWAFVRLILRI